MGAKDLSAIKPQLDANNIRLIGVGVEELGVEEFVKGEYWAGELYLDQKKQIYQGLGLKTMGYLATMGVIVSKKLRASAKRASDMGITGNIKGDSFQNGGTVVVDKGGKTIFEYRQEDPSNHADTSDILRALNIEPPKETGATGEGSGKSAPKEKVECNEDMTSEPQDLTICPILEEQKSNHGDCLKLDDKQQCN